MEHRAIYEIGHPQVHTRLGIPRQRLDRRHRNGRICRLAPHHRAEIRDMLLVERRNALCIANNGEVIVLRRHDTQLPALRRLQEHTQGIPGRILGRKVTKHGGSERHCNCYLDLCFSLATEINFLGCDRIDL